MRRLIDSLVIVNSVALLLLGGAGTFGYFYVTNPSNQEKAKAYAIEQVKKLLPVPEIPKIPLSKTPGLPF